MQHVRREEKRSQIGFGAWGSFIRVGLLLCLLGTLHPPAAVQGQGGFTFPVAVSFKEASAPGWVLGGSAVLTSGGADTTGNGWLRLTDNNGYKAGYAYYNTPIPTGRGLVVTFDYGAWGGSGADGLTFFLFDGATRTFNAGASGGSLGYAQKSGVNGLSGGYLGLGLDEFGNYSNPNEGRVGGAGFVAQAVAIRGPGSGTAGYAYLAGTTNLTKAPWNLARLDCPKNNGSCGNGTSRPADTVYFRRVQITVTPVGAAYQVAVAMKFDKNAAAWTPLFGPFTMPTSAPGTLKMGFAASTGGSTNFHEIRNLNVTPQVADLTATKAVQNATTGGGSVAPGDELLYTVVFNNHTTAAITGVHFTDTLPEHATYVANSATVPNGASLNATSPLSVTQITVPANGQTTVSFKVRVVSPIAAGVTQISNQGAYTYGGAAALTDGDATADGSQPTVIGVTAGPTFDTATKTVGYADLDHNGAVSPGDRLTYHVVLPNTGNQNAPTTSFTDLLPANTTYVAGSAAASGGTVTYNSTTRALGWTVGVNAGSQAALDFTVTVNSGVQIRDVISNQGAISYGTSSVLTDADLATPGKQPTQLLAGGGATLAATKSAEALGGGLQPGGQVRYTIHLTNTGSYSITGATFADSLPANTTYVAAATDNGVATFSAGALNVTGIHLTSGVAATIQLTVQLNSPLVGVTQIGNQGVASFDANQSGANNTTLPTDGDPASAGQQPTYTSIPHTDLAVTKTVDAATPAETGLVVYTVQVANQGANAAADVTVTDPLPAGLTYSASSASAGSYASPAWRVGTLAPGAGATLTLSATVALGQGGNAITNTVSVTSALYDANPANNLAGVGLLVRTTTLTGTVTDFETAAPLAGVSLTITDSQGHLCPATTDAGGRYTVTSGQSGCLLAPGVTTVAAAGGAPAGYLLRSATTALTAGTANTGDLTLVRPSLSGTVTDLGSGVTLVNATVTMTQGATLCTTTTGAGGAYHFAAGAGSPVCTLTAGAADLTAILPGYQATTVSTAILATGPTTQALTMGTADLLITKDDGQSAVQPGALLAYRLTVANQGSITATGIIVTDTLPAYLTYLDDDAGVTPAHPESRVYAWNLPELAPGAALSFTLRAQVASSLPAGTTRLANYATLSAASADRDHTNNEVSDVDSVVAYPDLTLFKSATADSSPIAAGGTITYTYIGDNRGSAIATGVRITDTLDENTTYVAGSAVLVVGEATWPLTTTYSSDLHQLLLELPTMPPGAEGHLRYKATVANPLPEGATRVTNTAEVTSNEPDLDPLDNRSTVVLGAQPGSDIFVQKVALPDTIPVLPGGHMLYRLRYGNLSLGIATNTVLTDAIPAHTSYVADSLFLDGVALTDEAGDDAGHYLGASRLISVSLGNLAGGAMGVITFTVRVDDVLPAGVTDIDNTAFITTAVSDPIPGDNRSTAVMGVAAAPDLTIAKSDGRSQVLAGDLLTYTIAYSNTGHQVAAGVQITDTLLAGLAYVAATPGGVFDAETGTLVWQIGELPVNALRTLTVTARVVADAQPAAVVANRVTVADDGANGEDINPAGNTATDSDLVIAPYLQLEKQATGPVYAGQPLTYTIAGYNSRYATAFAVVITDTLPAHTTLIPGSITGGGGEQNGVITWDLGDVAPGTAATLRFAVMPQAGAGGFTQTLPTLSTEALGGSLTVTSSTTLPPTGSRPWCDFDGCASFKGIYQGVDGLPPTGWNDNPRLTRFDDSSWSQPEASSTREYIYWSDPANLSAEWVTMHALSETVGNFTFFRQPFCLPLNATGLSAQLQVAGDDVSDLYLNGVYLGQEVGAGAADTFEAGAGIQSGINLLSVQLLNNRHNGHVSLEGRDHSGLLFNLAAAYTGLRPFAAAPAATLAGETVNIAVDELALGGRKPYSYTLDFGDGSAVAAYQEATGFTHLYATPGVYTATVTARAQYGCTGSDQIVISVLAAEANLLANPVVATYRDGNDHRFTATGGAGVELLPAADLSLVKTLRSAARVPGAAVVYQLVVANHGPNHVTGATVLDTLPASVRDVTWVCTAGSGALCTAAGSGPLTDTVSLQAGSTLTYMVTGTIAAGATGWLENTAAVTPPPAVTDLFPANNTGVDSGPLTPQVELTVSKSSSPQPGLTPGGMLHYTIVVGNGGPSDAEGVNVADTFPAAVTGVTWTCVASPGSTCTAAGGGHLDEMATIRAGGALTYTATALVDAGAPVGTVLANTATATYAGAPVSATDNNTLVAPTSLTAAKVALDGAGLASATTPFVDADGNGAISPGDTLQYRVLLRNGDAVAYDLLYNDTLDPNSTLAAGSVTCDRPCNVTQGNTAGDTAVSVSLASLAAGDTVTLHYAATVNALLPFRLAALANQGHAAGANAPALATDDPATADDGDATLVTLAMGSLRGVVWSDDGDGHRGPGEPAIPAVAVTLYYTDAHLQVQSAAAATDAAGAYTFTLLAAGEYQLGFALREGFAHGPLWGPGFDNWVDPATGATAVLLLGANEQRSDLGSGQISALAFGYLPASYANTTLAQDGARHIVPELVAERLYLGTGIAATADGVESATAGGPGDGVARSSSERWTPGATGSLTVTASGAGLLWGWFDWNDDGMFGEGEAQDLGTVVTGTQSVAVAIGTDYSDALPLFARFRLYPPDYSLSFADTGVVYNGEVEDFAWHTIHGAVFDDLNGNSFQDFGELGHAGLTVTVKGAGGAILATVQTDSSGVYTAPGFTTGAYSVELTLPPGYTAITPLVLAVTVNGTPPPANFAIQPQPDLAITQRDDPDPVVAGESLRYTLLLTNSNAIAHHVVVTNVLPSAMDFIAATAGCTAHAGTVTCELGDLAIGATHTLTIAGRIQAGAASGQITDTVTIASDQADLAPANNHTGVQTTVIRVTDLGISKTSAPHPHVAGEAITYTLVVTSAGPSTLAAITVTDHLPVEVTGAVYSATTGTYEHASGAWAGISLSAGDRITLTITGVVSPTQRGNLSNTAVVAVADTLDPVAGNNSATDVNAQAIGAIIGRVFEDINGDGAQGAGENVVPGATVIITDSQGMTQTVTPGAAGLYTATVVTGAATLFVQTPPHYLLTAGPNPQSLVVHAGANPAAAAGFVIPPRIAGTVYNDLNFDGAYAAGEPGIAGVRLTTNNGITATTDANGVYTFTVLPGTYTITETNAAGFVSTGDTGDPNDDRIPGVTVISGQTTTEQNFFDTLPADLTITKTGDPAVVVAGATLTYTIVATNHGPSDATGVWMTETLPSEVTMGFATPAPITGTHPMVWYVGDLAVGEQITVTVVVTVEAGASGLFTNTVGVAGSQADAAERTTAGRVADVAIVATSAPHPYVAGAAITYTLVVTNAGPSTVDALTLTVNLPPAILVPHYAVSSGSFVTATGSWTGLNLGAGNRVTLTITAIVAGSQRGALTVTATVTPTAAVDLVVAANSTTDVNVQATGTVTGTVFEDANGNGGQDGNEGAAPGATVIITDSQGVAQTVTPDAAGRYTATVVTGAATVAVQTPPHFQQTVGANPTPLTVGPATTDAGVDAFVVLPQIAGTVYADTNFDGAHNAGEPGIAGVLLTASHGATTTTDSSGMYTFTVLPGAYTITATNTTGYVSTGDVSTPNDDRIPGLTVASGQTVTGQDFFDTLPADLVLTKMASHLTPHVGSAIVFTLVVSNTGPGDATGVAVSETLASGYAYVASHADTGTYNGADLWAVGSLPDGTAAMLTITATVQPGGSYVNHAEVATGDQLDLDSTPGNGPQTPDEDDDANVTPAPLPVADLSIAKTSAPNPFTPGRAITYTIVVANAGPSTVTSLVVGDELPAALLSPLYTTSEGAFTAQSGVWTGVALGAGGTLTLTITANVDADAQGDLSNTATVSTAPAYDPVPDNNSATDTNSPQAGSVAGKVYQDANGNGIQDDGGDGVAGVTVTLALPTGQLRTVATDGAGLYRFADVAPHQTYTVTFSQPAGYDFTLADCGDDAMDSDVPAGGVVVVSMSVAGHWTLDAGLIRPMNLGDLVWLDADADGRQDPAESGLSGAVATLYLADGATAVTNLQGNPVAAQTTSISGIYHFTGLRPGGYVVQITPPAGYFPAPAQLADANNDGTLDSNIAVTVTPGVYASAVVMLTMDNEPAAGDDGAEGNGNPTVDFGFYQRAGLGDRVWFDTNQDGVQAAGEHGVAGVTVQLFTGAGAPVADMQTSTDGAYLFDMLLPGDYFMKFIPPAGYMVSPQDMGGANGNDQTANGGADDSDVNPATGQTIATNLASGETDRTWDLGLSLPTLPAAIGDLVWYDTDTDGIQDEDETGVPGVTVHLLNAGGQIVATTTTDANGGYFFENLPPAGYHVQFAPPAAYRISPQAAAGHHNDSDANPATGLTVLTTLTAGQVDRTWDMGLSLAEAPATIGGRVWFDTNRDGLQNTDETGVPGVAVQLYTGAGRLVAEQVTGAQGVYLFSNLLAGDYYVQFSPRDGYMISPQYAGGATRANRKAIAGANDSDADPVTGQTEVMTLAAGAIDLTCDMGLYLATPPASLGNLVWFDTDQDGLQDYSETGVPGVAVTLYASTNTRLSATTTDAGGYYQFKNLPPGDYFVQFSPPTGYAISLPRAGSDGAADSDGDPVTGKTALTTLSAGEDDPSWDLGLNLPVSPASLGDRVWYDTDKDGAQDIGESGVAGVVAHLYDAAGRLVAATRTGAQGDYRFINLPPGDYAVQFLPTAAYTASPQDAGGDDAADSDVNPETKRTPVIALAAGENELTADMGLSLAAAPSSISSQVWYDANQNGEQDAGETGVPGVLVQLYEGNGNLMAETTTDANGNYHFANLPPGDYCVHFHTPAGYIITDNGNGSGSESNVDPLTGQTAVILLDPGENDVSWDLGIYLPVLPAAIGDSVWLDGNQDGVQSPGEPGVPGVTVVLFRADGTMVATIVTGPDGKYLFANLPPGAYFVQFILPAGYVVTGLHQGGRDGLDSDAGAVTGRTPLTTLEPGETDLTWDLGIFQTPTALPEVNEPPATYRRLFLPSALFSSAVTAAAPPSLPEAPTAPAPTATAAPFEGGATDDSAPLASGNAILLPFVVR
jgi:uncharacterized repeat protein (TIGR01451 family)